MTAPSLLRWTKVMWSKFNAQLSGIPSAFESSISVASLEWFASLERR